MTGQEIVRALRCCAKGLGHDDACENCKVGEIQDRREYIEFAAANVIERLTAENAALRENPVVAWMPLPEAPEGGGKEIDWKQCRDSTLNVLINGPTSNGFGKDIFRKMARDLYGRLKAYEDIAELCGGVDRLRELAEADKDGRVLILEKESTDGTTYKPE